MIIKDEKGTTNGLNVSKRRQSQLLFEISFPKRYFQLFQKQEEWVENLKDKQAKQGKDKKVVFTARFSKANCKAKWSFKRDVSLTVLSIIYGESHFGWLLDNDKETV